MAELAPNLAQVQGINLPRPLLFIREHDVPPELESLKLGQFIKTG
jgi:hypothetical protein